MQKEKKMQSNLANVSYINTAQNISNGLGSGLQNQLGGSITGYNYQDTAGGSLGSAGTFGTSTGSYWYYYPYQQYPNYPTTYITYTQPEPTYEIKVEKVANGFIVHKNGQKFVVSKPEEIVKYLKDDKK